MIYTNISKYNKKNKKIIKTVSKYKYKKYFINLV